MSALRIITNAMTQQPPDQPCCWEELIDALGTIIDSPLTCDTEQILLDILQFEGELYLDESAEMPHSMSPEDMLKSFAVQALARWKGLAHLPDMLRLQSTTKSPALATIIRSVIAQTPLASMKPGRREVATDFVASSPSSATKS